MNKIRLPKKIMLLYLMIAPLSSLIFLLYIGGVFWMFFSCLLAYCIQLSVGVCLMDPPKSITYVIKVRNEAELDNLDSQYNKFRVIALSIVILTIILDTFPFLASFDWFCSGCVPPYEGGILVSLMAIIIILFWLFMIFVTNREFKSPSNQYHQNIKIEEGQRKRAEREQLQSKARHEHNVSLYGKGYTEISSHFVFNETERKVWIYQTEYSFDELLNAEIENITTQHTSGGEIVTKTKTGSMIGRAIVGGVLTGGIGAIIGGATAKKGSIVMPTEIHTEHRYNVLITTKNISHPIITIPCNDDVRLAQKCLATLRAIIHNK